MIADRLPDSRVMKHEDFSISGKSKEAIALAIIANDAIAGLNTNIPGATGGRPTVLGKISV
jgi:1,6-anhydro-N-acetylmuramate kinase